MVYYNLLYTCRGIFDSLQKLLLEITMSLFCQGKVLILTLRLLIQDRLVQNITLHTVYHLEQNLQLPKREVYCIRYNKLLHKIFNTFYVLLTNLTN